MTDGGLGHVWGEGSSATRHEDGHSSGGSPEAPVQASHERAGVLLDDLATGRPVDLPAGLQAVTSGRWVD